MSRLWKGEIKMTIKELMAQVDGDRVVDAYILLDYDFSRENYQYSIVEKYKIIPKLRNIIKENIRLFSECTSDVATNLGTIFITYEDDGDDYENQEKKSVESFATDDEEVLNVIDKDFHLLNHEGENIVYCYDHLPMKELANYVIAQSSLNELGKEICAAKILSDVFYWGLFPEDREKAVNDLFERANKPLTEEEIKKSEEINEQMRLYEENLMMNMSDEEKRYDLAKKHFEEETEDIVHRYCHKAYEKIEKRRIDMIKEEYKARG